MNPLSSFALEQARVSAPGELDVLWKRGEEGDGRGVPASAGREAIVATAGCPRPAL